MRHLSSRSAFLLAAASAACGAIQAFRYGAQLKPQGFHLRILYPESRLRQQAIGSSGHQSYMRQKSVDFHDTVGGVSRRDVLIAASTATAGLLLNQEKSFANDIDVGAAERITTSEGLASPSLADAVGQSASASSSNPLTTGVRDLGIEVPYTGKLFPLTKFLGSKATLVVNPKIDDPESLHQMPAITKLANKYAGDGLNVLLFPTDQGYFEADEDRVVRIKFYQYYGFGQYPRSVVFDKIDIVGRTIHPLYRFLCRSIKNPNGIARITLNYEKFLLDKDGTPVRRYPRKLEAEDFERDVQAVLAEKPLPAENRDFKLSWLKADQEAQKSEYAFKLGLNYYNNAPNMQF